MIRDVLRMGDPRLLQPSEPVARVSAANNSLLCCTGTLADFIDAENLTTE